MTKFQYKNCIENCKHFNRFRYQLEFFSLKKTLAAEYKCDKGIIPFQFNNTGQHAINCDDFELENGG